MQSRIYYLCLTKYEPNLGRNSEIRRFAWEVWRKSRWKSLWNNGWRHIWWRNWACGGHAENGNVYERAENIEVLG